VSKKISLLSICLFLVFGNINVYAQTSSGINLCLNNGAVIAFFNGIKNTRREAVKTMVYLKEFYGETAPNGEKISYELLYNDSINLFEDLMEVFGQRMTELEFSARETLRDRYELFFDMINGDGPWYKKILDAVPASANIAAAFLDDVRLRTQEVLFSLMNNSPKNVNYAEHKTRIDNWIVEGKKLLFVAHSQGNLFANVAYDYAKGKVGEQSVKVLHVAPASFRTSGGHVLADWDLVIEGLRSIVGNLPRITHAIPSYSNRPAGVNGKKDRLGHGFVEIYINPNLFTSVDIGMYMDNALNSLKAPYAAQSGFFTATLTWGGSGDADLHVYEPDGTWVYYVNKQGNAGYLDIDDRGSNGPEHYYASCDANKIQTGVYAIKVANFARAKGSILRFG
jgi:hypothetical protein